jgi:hypothetical protein
VDEFSMKFFDIFQNRQAQDSSDFVWEAVGGHYDHAYWMPFDKGFKGIILSLGDFPSNDGLEDCSVLPNSSSEIKDYLRIHPGQGSEVFGGLKEYLLSFRPVAIKAYEIKRQRKLVSQQKKDLIQKFRQSEILHEDYMRALADLQVSSYNLDKALFDFILMKNKVYEIAVAEKRLLIQPFSPEPNIEALKAIEGFKDESVDIYNLINAYREIKRMARCPDPD